jgi:hypothetical protein
MKSRLLCLILLINCQVRAKLKLSIIDLDAICPFLSSPSRFIYDLLYFDSISIHLSGLYVSQILIK